MSISDSFSQLTRTLENIEKRVVLNEGGNVFKDEEGNILTQRIQLEDVLPTVRWLENLTGLDLTGQERDEAGVPTRWLGSTGRMSDSGDIDLVVTDTTKDELYQKLLSFVNKNNLEPKEWIKKAGELHFRTPIAGDPDKGYVQTDFNFYADEDSTKWAKFYMSGTSPEYKGFYRNVLLSSLAKPLGYKLGGNGLIDRSTNEPVKNGKDPDYVAQVLLGKGHDKSDLRTVEKIYDALKDDPRRDEKLADFRGFIEKQGIEEPNIEPPVSEDSSHFLARLRDRIVNQGMEMIIESERKDPRIPHPEDAFLTGGSEAADHAIKQLEDSVNNAEKVTIKWDGKPALIWGRLPNGKLAVMDKYMFDAGYAAQSPEDWKKYDKNKRSGTMRGDLYTKLNAIWPGLDLATKGDGFYWGDMMWAGQLKPQDGAYRFKPNTVEYAIPANSDLGKMISDKTGGIVVHQKFANLGDKNAEVWNGKGLENVSGGVAIISPNVGINFSLNMPSELLNTAKSTLNKYRKEVDELLFSIPASTRGKIKTYFNQSIVGNTKEPLHKWLSGQISAKQYQALVSGNPDEKGRYSADSDNLPGKLFTLENGKVVPSTAYKGLTEIWNSIYRLKLNLAQQLESQVKGLNQSTGGKAEGEGFVVPTSDGLVKLVNRGLFSTQNVQKNN